MVAIIRIISRPNLEEGFSRQGFVREATLRSISWQTMNGLVQLCWFEICPCSSMNANWFFIITFSQNFSRQETHEETDPNARSAFFHHHRIADPTISPYNKERRYRNFQYRCILSLDLTFREMEDLHKHP
jgi:hypothetical protein